MPKPPTWLPFLGPPLAGVAAGIGGRYIEGFLPLIALAVVVGFSPIIAYHLWKRAHHRS